MRAKTAESARSATQLYNGPKDIVKCGVGFRQSCVTDLKVCNEDHIRMIANGFAIFKPRKPRQTPPLSTS